MLSFKSPADLAQLPPDHPAYAHLSDLVQRLIVEPFVHYHRPYDPEWDGCLLLVEQGDADRVLSDIWPGTDDTLATLPWEGIRPLGIGYWEAVVITTNESGYVFLVPDADWIGDELRQVIEANLDADI